MMPIAAPAIIVFRSRAPIKYGMMPISPTDRSAASKKKKRSSPPRRTEAPFGCVRYCQIGSASAAMASNEAMWGSTSSGGAAGPCAFPTVPRLLRSHVCDWIALFLLVAVDGALNLVEPFHRFVGAGMMADLRYPMKTNTVPVWAVPLIAVIGPVVIFLMVYIRRRNVYDLHHAILGILFAVVITGVLTDAIKDAVGRPRPNFFWRCFPDGKAVYDNVTTGVICHGDPSAIKEGHKSFPSGHTSCSWPHAHFRFITEQEEESRTQLPTEMGAPTSHELDALEAGRRGQL